MIPCVLHPLEITCRLKKKDTPLYIPGLLIVVCDSLQLKLPLTRRRDRCFEPYSTEFEKYRMKLCKYNTTRNHGICPIPAQCVCHGMSCITPFSRLPYLPVYNARPCIIRTPILDCTLKEKKKKSKQKTEEVVTQN